MNGKTYTYPTHGTRLDNGPIWFRCPRGHSLPAADLSHEFTPRPADTEHTLGVWCFCKDPSCAGWNAYVADFRMRNGRTPTDREIAADKARDERQHMSRKVMQEAS